VSQDGDLGRDDYGLPRVDIDIPDDARELYPDMLAYYREQRALKRFQRAARLRAMLHRDGVAMPLVAGCLVLAMLAGMVLTMLSSSSYFSGIVAQQRASTHSHTGAKGAAGAGPQAGRSGAAAITQPAPPAGAGQQTGHAPPSAAGTSTGTATRLPDKTVTVAGRPVALRALTSTALILVPVHCGCLPRVRRFLAQARSAGVRVYLVGPPSGLAERISLAGSAPPSTVQVATDTGNTLAVTYRAVGLIVLLVSRSGAVQVVAGLSPSTDLRRQLRAIGQPG
jgi:hypothetical protein